MNKKITSSALAALMIAGSTSFTALAAMSNGTVVIGNKAFDLTYANDPANADEIGNAIVAGGNAVYIKDFEGNWIDNATNKKVEASVIPAVVYKGADKKEVKFDAADKEAVGGVLKVESVKATKVDKLEVKFSTAVDTADVKLAVTKGTSPVEATVAWNADKTVATVTTTAKMTNGVYTVTATSAANKTSVTGTTEIKSQYVAEIKLLNNVALTGKSSTGIDSDRAYIYYDVLDQYGESLRTSTNIEWSFSASKVSDNRTTGMLTVKRSDDKAFTYGEKIYVTGVFTKTGITVSKTVEIGAKQALNSIEVAGYVKKGTSEIIKTLPAGFAAGTYYMVYNVKDQNGNAMVANNPVANNDVTFVSDNVLLIKELISTGETSLTVNGNEYNAVLVTPGMSVGKGGEVNITAIANKTGAKTTLNTVIGEDHILTSFVMSAPTTMIADGESVVVPFEAKDQKGEKITNFTSLAKQTTFNKLTFTTSTGTLKLYENADGTATLKFYDSAAPAWSDSQTTDGIDRTVSLTSVVVGGDTSGQLLYIQDKARPEAISAVDMDNVLVEQGSDLISLSSFDFLDQYGRKMSGVDAYKSGTDANTTNKNEGNIYDNGFFAASKAGSLKGTDFAGNAFMVRATFKGDATYLLNGITPLVSDAAVEISTTGNLDLKAAANTVVSSKAGFAVKYEIAKTKTTLAEAQATSTAKTEAVTVVDVKSVKGYTAGDLDKFYVQTAKSADVTGDAGAKQLNTTNINTTLSAITMDFGAGVTTAAAIDVDHEKTVKISGTYNGETVKIPAAYLNVVAGKLAATGAKVDAVQDGKIRWSDLYDGTTARYVRKDATDTLKVTILDLDNANAVIDTVSKAVTFADAAPQAATIADIAEALTIKPGLTVIASPTHVANSATITVDGNDYTVKDQYGVDFASATVTFKVASVVENAAGYAENNFAVSGNDTGAVTITGAERGDTYVLTVKASSAAGVVTKQIKVTVGADTSANINGSANNYLDDLIKNKLEPQRNSGLN